MNDGPVPVTRRCCRCAVIYIVGEHSTDTHCPECLLKGMP